MTPNWIRANAEFNCAIAGNDVRLTVKEDTRDYENIFKLPLLPAGVLDRHEDITVRMHVGVELPEPPPPPPIPPPKPPPPPRPDPLAFMISDGRFAVGIQLRDPGRDYKIQGPYVGIEGTPGFVLQDVDNNIAELTSTTSTNNPDQIEMVIKPSERWGSAFCPIDDGHKLCALYSRTLDLTRGIDLDVYREDKAEIYNINYIEVWIYEDSPLKVVPGKLKKALEDV